MNIMLIDVYRSRYYTNKRYETTIVAGGKEYDIYLLKETKAQNVEPDQCEYGVYPATPFKDIINTDKIIAIVTANYFPDRKLYCLGNLEVLPSCQAKGLGSQLIEWSKQNAIELGAERLELIGLKALVPVMRKVDQEHYVQEYAFDRNAYVYYCHANMEFDEAGTAVLVEDDLKDGINYSSIVFKYNLKAPTKPTLKKFAHELRTKKDFTEEHLQKIVISLLKNKRTI